jgi:hypothetical protein
MVVLRRAGIRLAIAVESKLRCATACNERAAWFVVVVDTPGRGFIGPPQAVIAANSAKVVKPEVAS